MPPLVMEKEDARKQSRKVLHERRKQVIRLYRKGVPVMQIVGHSGLSWYDGAFNADKLIEFLGALIKDVGRKVFLILNTLRVQHSKTDKAWVEEYKEKIELFYLSSYSPELNPEERLNADLKQALYTKLPVRTKAKQKAATTEYMQALEKSPERVKKFFHDARVKYAA